MGITEFSSHVTTASTRIQTDDKTRIARIINSMHQTFACPNKDTASGPRSSVYIQGPRNAIVGSMIFQRGKMRMIPKFVDIDFGPLSYSPLLSPTDNIDNTMSYIINPLP
jgi:hypothetical protein